MSNPSQINMRESDVFNVTKHVAQEKVYDGIAHPSLGMLSPWVRRYVGALKGLSWHAQGMIPATGELASLLSAEVKLDRWGWGQGHTYCPSSGSLFLFPSTHVCLAPFFRLDQSGSRQWRERRTFLDQAGGLLHFSEFRAEPGIRSKLPI